jgi:hypothetical protein
LERLSRPVAEEAEDIAEGVIVLAGQGVTCLLVQAVEMQAERDAVVFLDVALPLEIAVEERPVVDGVALFVRCFQCPCDALRPAKVGHVAVARLAGAPVVIGKAVRAQSQQAQSDSDCNCRAFHSLERESYAAVHHPQRAFVGV